MTNDVVITGELIKADRVSRPGTKQVKASRQDYAELVGLTPTQIQNLENGRKLRPDEEEKLRPFIEEYLTRTGGALTGATATDSSSGAAADGNVTAPPDGGSTTPVYIYHPEDDEDAPLGDPVVTAGSGLQAVHEWKLEGYHLTNSELATFRRCLRRWWLGYYRELRFKVPLVTGAAAIGTRLHLCLAAYYSTRRDDPFEVLAKTLEHDREILRARGDEAGLAELEKDGDLCHAMLEGYLEWVQETGVDDGWTIIGDEMVIEAPLAEILGQQVILVGKLDIRKRRDIDGARKFMDHKSVGSLTEPLKTLRINSQMLHYHLLEFLDARQIHAETSENAPLDVEDLWHEHLTTGGEYNMLRKVKRSATAKPPFFARTDVDHNLLELKSYHERVLGEAEDIINLRALLDAGENPTRIAYPNPQGDCSWQCEFLLVCPMLDDGSRVEDFIEAYYEKGDPHERYRPYGDGTDWANA